MKLITLILAVTCLFDCWTSFDVLKQNGVTLSNLKYCKERFKSTLIQLGLNVLAFITFMYWFFH